VRFLYPSPPEQDQIADYLYNKTQQIDTLIEKKQKLIEFLRERRTVNINKVITKGLDANVPMKDLGLEWLGEIPEHWKMKKLKFVATIQFSNVDKKSKAEENEVLLCNYMDVYNHEYINDPATFM
jgi:type I restriction enzyme S subunit